MLIWLVSARQILETLFLAVKYGPDVVALVREITQLVKQFDGSDDEKATYKEALTAAVTTYRDTGDRTPLRDLRSHMVDRCFSRGSDGC